MSSDAPSLPYGLPNSSYTIPAKRRRFPIVSILVVFGIIAMLVAVILPNMCRSTEGSNRVRCASNMKQIGLAAIMWANEHGGQFPPDLDTILEHEDIASSVFVCPASSDSPAVGATTQETVASLHQPGHLSYVYIGKGLTVNSPADTVVLYELPANHSGGDMSVSGQFKSGPKGDGMNVLCADGHVEWVGAFEADAIYKQVKDGVFPVRLASGTQQPP